MDHWEAATPREGAMASRNSNGNDRERPLDAEIERYREAADSALWQLEWIVGYLHKIRKPQIARVLDRNRKQILKDIGASG
jgi:hypothetical protein